MYKYQVYIAEIYKQGYIVESKTPLTKEETVNKIYNEGVDPVEDDFEYSHSDLELSSIELLNPDKGMKNEQH